MNLNKYKNHIGIGVMILLIILIGLTIYTHTQQLKIAKDCGFETGKVKCVCTEQAWNKYQADLKIEETSNNTLIFTQHLNSETP